MAAFPDNEKLTFSTAMSYLSECAKKGWQQGTELSKAKESLRVVIAYKIKEERRAKGISQEEMSTRINTNSLTYRGYENCKSDIPLVIICRIADVLEISVDYLLGRTENKKITDNSSIEERIAKLEEHLKSL